MSEKYPGSKLDTFVIWFGSIAAFVLFWALVYMVGHLP